MINKTFIKVLWILIISGILLSSCGDKNDSTAPGILLNSIEITPASAAVFKNETFQFTATGHYSDDSTREITESVTWVSSVLGVARISNTEGVSGAATGIGTGVSTISATLSGVTGTATLSVTDPQAVPPRVTGVYARPSEGKVILEWLNASRATHYTLYWSLESGVTKPSGNVIPDIKTLSYTFEGLESGATFHCIVTASNANGESDPSREVQCKADPNIDLQLLRPHRDVLIDRMVEIFALHDSTYQMADVSAEMDGLQTQLAFMTKYVGRYERTGWDGSLDLNGMDKGTKTLIVRARDALGHVSTASMVCVYDQKPKISVNEPLNFTVARPSLSVSASCTDDAPEGCQKLDVFVEPSTILASGKDHVAQVIDLEDKNGKTMDLTFSATDTAGQKQTVTRTVYVESSVRLTGEERVKGKIWDLGTDRILYLDTTTGRNTLTLYDRSTHDETRIMDETGKIPVYGYLTPQGALFVEQSGNVLTNLLYEWRGDHLEEHGSLNSSSSLKVKGSYAIWNEYPSQALIYYHLVSGNTTNVSSEAGNWMNDVAANGDAVFWTSGNASQIYRYRSGTTTPITNDAPVLNTYPLTDGFYVIYRKKTSEESYLLTLFTGAGEETLGSKPYTSYTPYQDYQVNNRWTAFTLPGIDNVLQVWRRSQEGALTQLSFLGSHSRISALGPDGTVAWISGEKMYLSRPGSADLHIGSSLGKALYVDNRLCILIGRSAFQVSVP